MNGPSIPAGCTREQVARVVAALNANPGTRYTPSRMAREVKCPTVAAWSCLMYLERHGEARAEGNGAWRKWFAL